MQQSESAELQMLASEKNKDILPKTTLTTFNVGEKAEGQDLAKLPIKLMVDELSVYYGKYKAVDKISMQIS